MVAVGAGASCNSFGRPSSPIINKPQLTGWRRRGHVLEGGEGRILFWLLHLTPFTPKLTVLRELGPRRNNKPAPFNRLTPLFARAYVNEGVITWRKINVYLVQRERSFHCTVSLAVNGVQAVR